MVKVTPLSCSSEVNVDDTTISDTTQEDLIPTPAKKT
jgi:hypothetical protein